MSTDLALSNSLPDLAARIRIEHEAAKDAVRRGIEHAMAAGDLLIEAKSRVQHGEWLPWLAEHCAISERTAQLYMRLARERPAIEAKSAGIADLTVDGAAKLLAKPAHEIDAVIPAFSIELPRAGHCRIGMLSDGGTVELFGIIEDGRTGYYCLSHMMAFGHLSSIEPPDEELEELIENPAIETISRPMKPEGIHHWFDYVMHRPAKVDRIEWKDHPADRWPFQAWEQWFKRDPQRAAG